MNEIEDEIDREDPDYLRRRTAEHESGHAVMAWLMNRGPYSIEIFENQQDEKVGKVEMLTGFDPGELRPDIEKDLESAKEAILCILGGVAADLLSGGESDGSYGDHEDALEVLKMVKPTAEDEDLLPFVLTAQEILARPENWGRVMQMAEILCDIDFLSGERAREIIANSEWVEEPFRKPVKVRIRKKE